ncbi:hypothetical protein BU16DRAFT_290004 [Lophium mytilinum]|uniref:Fungal N-terminal domain-containing protein n=1 Tax=Lophium mytilinum TaxID=390894 RepID=A0A6A6R336_9PEZI|nr:hypothetical protein BU16DRAFT_290004 [Lophium mytilinum]
MEAVAAVSSIVQLVSFSGICLSKTAEIYRSRTGILDTNADIELVTNHLILLKDEVEASATSAGDASLIDLCTAVATTSSELLGVLETLKVQAGKTKWKSLRKGIRSVWSKEKVLDLEHRLAFLRDQLSFHCVDQLRQKLIGFESEIKGFLEKSDLHAKHIFDAILNDRDLFTTALQEQQLGSKSEFEDTRALIKDSHHVTRAQARHAITDESYINRKEHAITRQEVQTQTQTIMAENSDLHDNATKALHSCKAGIIGTVQLNCQVSQAEHKQTQSQIAELKEALDVLTAQIKIREEELKQLLSAYSCTRNKKKKKELGERSNAATAALLALETIYRSLQAVLASLKAGAIDIFDMARSKDVWNITDYARRMSIASKIKYASWQDLRDDGTELRMIPIRPPNSIEIQEMKLWRPSTLKQ